VSLGTSEGELKGEVHVAAGARLEASVFAGHVVIDGEFRGRVTAQKLEFGPSAVAHGDFRAEAVVMREGAFVEGSFNAPQETAQQDVEHVEPSPVSEEDLHILAEAEPVTASVN
jgi:cytoskeletal protein CcmA (bactofilin family)